MRTLSQRDLLAAWEAGLGLAPTARAVELLRAAGSGEEDPSRLTPGWRDAALLEMRERLLGPDLSAVATCPRCGEEQEFDMHVPDIRTATAIAPTGTPELSITHQGYSVAFRLPETADLVAVSAGGCDADAMRTALLECCILRAELAGVECRAAELPEDVITAISARMAEADPQGEIELSIECSSCRYAWTMRTLN